MNKYKIMLVDDRLNERKENLFAFFTNEILDNCKSVSDIVKENFRKKLAVEFEIIAPKKRELLDDFIKKNIVDAYVLDVVYDEVGWEGCKLQDILSSIRVHNPQAPVFVYSSDWQDKAILQEVSSAFRNGFPGKMVSYYYDLKEMNDIVMGFMTSGKEEKLDRVIHEREFIREVIARHQGRTTKMPKSQDGNVNILHISDIQYGDKDEAEYKAISWNEIIKTCRNMQRSGEMAGIDLLVITGDVLMHGIKSERMEAEKDLCLLFKGLWQDEFEDGSYKERILLVPGNHDYDLNYCVMDYYQAQNKDKSREIDFDKVTESLKDKKVIANYLCEGFTEFKNLAYKITENNFFLTSEQFNYVEDRFKDWNIRFICLNTSGGICAEKTNKVEVNEEDYRSKIIEREGWNDEIYTIVLSHHTPLYSSELMDEEAKKFAIACNSIMQACEVKLWLGGHRHLHVRKEDTKKENVCTISESATVRLEEDWGKDDAYKVNTEAGEIISHRGFQIIKLIKKNDTFQPDIIKYVFNEFGRALRVQS